MIWLFLLLRHSAKWWTGAQERFFSFCCEHCGASLAAMVRVNGYGSGRNQFEAERAAHAAADGMAFRHVAAAGCPGCGKLSSASTQGWERARVKTAKMRVVAPVVALIASLLTFALFALPAIRDLRHSIWLLVAGVMTAMAVGAFAFGVLSGRVTTPVRDPLDVWFSHSPQHGPSAWFRAQAGRVPHIEQPYSALRIVSWISFTFGAVVAITAGILWSDTFRKVYVVNTSTHSGEIVAKIDGAESGRISWRNGKDVAFLEAEVRTSTKHTVTVVMPDHTEKTYELDPDTSSHGWVVAPLAKERDFCIASTTTYYNTTAREDPEDGLLNTAGEADFVVLSRSHDKVFEPAPSTIQLKSTESATRKALRGIDCRAAERGDIVAFGDGPLKSTQAEPRN